MVPIGRDARTVRLDRSALATLPGFGLTKSIGTVLERPAIMHVAIQEALDGKIVDWMEKVSDEEYLSLRNR
jgi:hypothetical protein